MSWKDHKWLILALVLVAYALSIPILTALYPKDVLLSIDPQVVIGLVALEIGVLALVGTALYILLRREVESRIREEIVAPVEVVYGLTWSYMANLEYSKTWSDHGFPRNIQDTLRPLDSARFQTMVSMAVTNAQMALERAEFSSGVSEVNLYDAINALAYHRATRYFLWGDSADRSEAVKHASKLESRGGSDAHVQETIAWVKTLCHARHSDQFKEGWTTVSSLLRRDSEPRHWQRIMRAKYTSIFGMDLPSIPS